MTNKQSGSFWFSSKGLAAFGLIAAVTYFLLIEHRQHVVAFLPYLILLLCPLMHLFMHGGHGHGGHDHGEQQDKEREAYRRGLEDGKRRDQHDQHDHHHH